MRTITLTVYEFDELKSQAREEALDWARNHLDYPWDQENRKVLTEFCRYFPVTAKDWEYGGHNAPAIQASFSISESVAALTGIRLATYLWNNYGQIIERPRFLGSLSKKVKFTPVYSRCQRVRDCNLTGYWLDYEILAPVWLFLDRPDQSVTLEDILMQSLRSWVQACHTDTRAYYSDESLSEELKCNKQEFLDSGKRMFRV